MENTAIIIFTGKTAAQLIQANEIDTTSAAVPTNYHEEPKRKKSLISTKNAFDGRLAARRSDAVSCVNSCADENLSPMRKRQKNTPKNGLAKKITAQTSSDDVSASVVATNCLLINRFVDVNKDFQKLQNSFHEQKVENIALRTQIAEKDQQILSLQQQIKAFNQDIICDDLISFEDGNLEPTTTIEEQPQLTETAGHEEMNTSATDNQSETLPSNEDSVNLPTVATVTSSDFKWTPLN